MQQLKMSPTKFISFKITLKFSFRTQMITNSKRNLFRTMGLFSYSTRQRFFFSESFQQKFYRERFLRQQNRQRLIYNFQPQRLIHSPIDLRYLVPTNIFQEQVTIQEYPKTIVQDKTQNHFQNSYVAINLNISQNIELRNTLIRFDEKYVRIGRLLEIMDMIASLVSFRHCFGSFKRNNPFTLVTGSIQSLQFFDMINSQENIQVQGFVNNTGKTSMEVQVIINQGQKFKASSFFTMVCRQASDLNKGHDIPKLCIDKLTSEQLQKAKIRKKIAIENIDKRKRQISESFDFRPPNQDQIKEIHELFLQRKNSSEIEHGSNVTISSTSLETNGIMHLQDRNINGKMFGGFLMREMLQIGWVAGRKFLKGGAFQIIGITDIYFLSAVQIGDGLTISASITYTQGNIQIVTVQAYTSNFNTGKKKLCCTCQLILETKSEYSKSVYPCSYEEALNYLNSRRTFAKMFGNAISGL